MLRRSYHIIWRWIALVVLIGNVLFNYAYLQLLPHAKSMQEVSTAYPSLFTPAPYTFAIWGLIYVCFAAYAIFQLLPSQYIHSLYDSLAKPFAFINLMLSCWVFSFSQEEISVSLLFMLFVLLAGIVLFLRSKEAILREQVSVWITIPFSLFLGWICIATIANFEVLIQQLGWKNFLGDAPFIILLLAGAMGLGIWVSSNFKDLVFPLVISWASFGISVGQKTSNREVSSSAFIIGVILLLWTVGFAIWLSGRKRPKLSIQ